MKPCPFCGSVHSICTTTTYTCGKCKASAPIHISNTRPIEDALRQENVTLTSACVKALNERDALRKELEVAAQGHCLSMQRHDELKKELEHYKRALEFVCRGFDYSELQALEETEAHEKNV